MTPTFSQTLNGVPFVYVDNFFSEFETAAMLKELGTLRAGLLAGHDTGGAVNRNGALLKKTLALFLCDYYKTAPTSSIYAATRKYFSEDVLVKLRGKAWFFRYIAPCYNIADMTQVLYYENNATYGSHIDTANITALCWLHKTPKAFVGGDLVLEENTKVEMRHNRVLFFPSITRHEVTPVEMLEEKDGYGRYCVSTFIHTDTSGVDR